MNKYTFALLLTATLSSCAFNKLFLYPRTLDNNSVFKEYSEEFNDTLTLSFIDNGAPIIKNSKSQTVNFSYNIENVNFKNSEENTINGWLLKPDTYNGTTIYFLHGNSGNLVFNFPLAVPFAKAGYQVFLIDYTGFGFSEGKANRKSVLKDANEGLEYLLNREDIKYEKLIIYGQSLGGHLSCVVANQNQNKIDGLVVEGAFSSHKDISADQVPILSRIFVREMYSAKKNIPEFKKPVLIIHSTEDETVGFKHGETLFESATNPKSFYQIENRHILGPLHYFDSISYKIEEMLK